MNRRAFLAASAGALVADCDLSWREGLFNSCRAALPPALAASTLVRDAWRGLDPAKVWDVHCHLFGNGDSGAGPWFNPAMENLLRPQQYVQRLFYMNAGCVHDSPGKVDASVVDRLQNQCATLPPGAKVVLLAFDWARDDAGTPVRERSTFYVPDAYAASVAARDPARFECSLGTSVCDGRDAAARLGSGARCEGGQVAAFRTGNRSGIIPTVMRSIGTSPRCACRCSRTRVTSGPCAATTRRSAIRCAFAARSMRARGSSSPIVARWEQDATSTRLIRRLSFPISRCSRASWIQVRTPVACSGTYRPSRRATGSMCLRTSSSALTGTGVC